jgi:hypothetical protein
MPIPFLNRGRTLPTCKYNRKHNIHWSIKEMQLQRYLPFKNTSISKEKYPFKIAGVLSSMRHFNVLKPNGIQKCP